MKITTRKIKVALRNKFPMATLTVEDRKVIIKDGSDYETIFEESGKYFVKNKTSISHAGSFEVTSDKSIKYKN